MGITSMEILGRNKGIRVRSLGENLGETAPAIEAAIVRDMYGTTQVGPSRGHAES